MAFDRWAIFYADGSVVEGGGEDDEIVEVTFRVNKKWLEAPNDGIQAVIQENPYSCRYVWRGQDHYFQMSGGEVHMADDIGPYLREHLKGMMKFGLCINREEHEAIQAKVNAYTKIPRDGCERQKRPEQED